MYAILIIGLLAVLIAGWRSTRNSSEEDYYLAGKSYGPVTVGLSAFAAGNSGFLLIGAVGLGFTAGVAAFTFSFGALLGDLIFWTFLAEKVLKRTSKETNTVPERLASSMHITNPALVRSVAAIILLLCLSPYTAMQVHVLGSTIEHVFPLDSIWFICGYMLLICSYIAIGGFRSSISASMVQATIILATAVMVLYGILAELGARDLPISAVVDAGIYTKTGELEIAPETFAFQLFGYTAFGIALALALPQFIVRLFALRHEKDVRPTKWVFIGATQFVLNTMIVLGIALRIFIPDINDAELGLFEFSSQFLAPAATGLALAGVIAAISSTAEALIVIISSAIGADILGAKIGHLNRKSRNLISHGITAVVGVTVTILALTTKATFFELMIHTLSSLVGAFAPAMVITTFGYRTSSTALAISIISGFMTSILWILADLSFVFNSSLAACAVSVLTHYLAMRKTTSPS